MKHFILGFLSGGIITWAVSGHVYNQATKKFIKELAKRIKRGDYK